LRDPAWRKKDADGSLRVSPVDADRLGLVDGDTATLTTKRASVAVTVAVDDTVRSGHVSLPNGRSEERRVGKEGRNGGVTYQAEDGIRGKLVTGVQTCALPISCATPRGGRRTQTVRCACRPSMPTGSVSSTATPPH